MIRHWLVFGFGVVGAALVLSGVYAWTSRPDTYRDAVRELLDQHHIIYTGLEVREICLPDPHCTIGSGTRTFSTVVIAMVTVHRGTISSGQLTCYDRRGDCYLYLPSLDIQHAPLRDLRGVRLLPKPLVRVWEFGAAWLRGWFRPTSGS